MEKTFIDFSFSDFWDNRDYALKEYVSKEPNDEIIKSIEEELGYKLPNSYIEMMKVQNGGIPHNCCYPTDESTSWAGDHIAISGIYGIEREKDYSLAGGLGSQFMIEEWGYPNIGIYICDCPSAGHDLIMLDYSKCGPNGEPQVVHVDQESDYRITHLAKDFETFIRGLINEDVYDTSAEDLLDELKSIETGKFSTVLTELFESTKSNNFDKILRSLLTKLTNEKGYFALHADELSHLTYDIQFHLFSINKKVTSIEQYLKEYPKMIAFGDREISTNGYEPDFISDWLNERVSNKKISKKLFKGLKFTTEYENKLLEKIKEFE